MKYVWGSGTDTGKVRDHNEDSLYPQEGGRTEGPIVLMVADGMGGAVGGEVASRLAIEAASEQAPDEPVEPSDRVLAANTAVILATEEDRSLTGMGTTMTLVSSGQRWEGNVRPCWGFARLSPERWGPRAGHDGPFTRR